MKTFSIAVNNTIFDLVTLAKTRIAIYIDKSNFIVEYDNKTDTIKIGDKKIEGIIFDTETYKPKTLEEDLDEIGSTFIDLLTVKIKLDPDQSNLKEYIKIMNFTKMIRENIEIINSNK